MPNHSDENLINGGNWPRLVTALLVPAILALAGTVIVMNSNRYTRQDGDHHEQGIRQELNKLERRIDKLEQYRAYTKGRNQGRLTP